MNVLLNLQAGWFGFLAGALSGAALGLFFHRPEWLGGYDSFRRRMLRLGHIACFGIGLLNVLFALSVAQHPLPDLPARIASLALLVALVSMPLCCFLSAWRESWRHLFPLPVAAALTSVVAILIGWR